MDTSLMRDPNDLPCPPEGIFVFGSNLAGRHGAGAALMAVRRYGAIYGVGGGRQGQSYAIPTKDLDLHTLSLRQIRLYVTQFPEYAKTMSDYTFYVPRIGCGLAGYTDDQIAPMFINVPINCILPKEWRDRARQAMEAVRAE